MSHKLYDLALLFSYVLRALESGETVAGGLLQTLVSLLVPVSFFFVLGLALNPDLVRRVRGLRKWPAFLVSPPLHMLHFAKQTCLKRGTLMQRKKLRNKCLLNLLVCSFKIKCNKSLKLNSKCQC